jgi:hypothetical protein
MKRSYIPGLVDVVTVDDPAEIRQLVNSKQLDRRFDRFCPVLNGFLLRKITKTLSFDNHRFPTLLPSGNQERSIAQEELWNRLNLQVRELTPANRDVRDLATWVKGMKTSVDVGVLAQQAVGRLFDPEYKADAESWEAAQILGQAPKTKGLAAIVLRLSGKVMNAKVLLASKVEGDRAGIHGTGVAIHNLVKGFHRMQFIFRDRALRAGFDSERIVHECLFAPEMILRQATENGNSSGCPFKRGTVFLLQLGKGHEHPDTEDLIFLDATWSRCPAEQWIPALLRAVWECANDESY